MFCPDCGFELNLADFLVCFCENCGTDIREIRERSVMSLMNDKTISKIPKKRKRLYNNPQKRERKCSKCGKIKSYNNFKNYSGGSGKKRSICKKCEIKAEAFRLQMKSWVNKIQAINYVTNGINKCQICGNIGITELPKLDFHHPNPELSTRSAREKGFWRSVRYKSWTQIKKEINKQQVVVVCRNCHQKLQATVFDEYKNIILENNDPKIKLKFIKDHSIRQIIRKHIRKKIVSLKLWEGKCTICGCGITSYNIDNLPILEMHHIDSKLKKLNISYIFKIKNSIEEIIKIIHEEKCTCLCRNCHMMTQSTFFRKIFIQIFQKHRELFGLNSD